MANQTNVGSTTNNIEESYIVTMGDFDLDDTLKIEFPPERSVSYRKNKNSTLSKLTEAGKYNIERDENGKVVRRTTLEGRVITDKTTKGMEH